MTKDERPGYAADSGQAQSAPVLPPGSVTLDFLTGAWSGGHPARPPATIGDGR